MLQKLRVLYNVVVRSLYDAFFKLFEYRVIREPIKKITGRREKYLKNTHLCCRFSGKVYSFKVQMRVAR